MEVNPELEKLMFEHILEHMDTDYDNVEEFDPYEDMKDIGKELTYKVGEVAYKVYEHVLEQFQAYHNNRSEV